MIVFEGLENLDTTRCLLVLIIHEDEDGDDDCQVRDEVEARGRISAQGLWVPSLGLEPIFRARRPCYSRNFSHQPMLSSRLHLLSQRTKVQLDLLAPQNQVHG